MKVCTIQSMLISHWYGFQLIHKAGISVFNQKLKYSITTARVQCNLAPNVETVVTILSSPTTICLLNTLKVYYSFHIFMCELLSRNQANHPYLAQSCIATALHPHGGQPVLLQAQPCVSSRRGLPTPSWQRALLCCPLVQFPLKPVVGSEVSFHSARWHKRRVRLSVSLKAICQ